MDLYDQLDTEFCTPAYLQKGVKYPTQCKVSCWLPVDSHLADAALVAVRVFNAFWWLLQGPTYKFVVSGGYCYIVTETKAVTCVKPTVTLKASPGVCSLKHTTPTTVFVSFRFSSLCMSPSTTLCQCHCYDIIVCIVCTACMPSAHIRTGQPSRTCPATVPSYLQCKARSANTKGLAHQTRTLTRPSLFDAGQRV